MVEIDPIRMQQLLQGVDYPARKGALLACAARNGASGEVCDVLARLPDREYATPTAVSRAVAGVR